jgi:hypothetical protein
MSTGAKTKPRCKNCGDETSFPANSVGDRAHREWCVHCYRQYTTQRVVASDGSVYWKNNSLYKRNRFDAHGNHPSTDS